MGNLVLQSKRNLVIFKNDETKTPKIDPGSVSNYRVLRPSILLLAGPRFSFLPVSGEGQIESDFGT